jgi:hypothetical protein
VSNLEQRDRHYKAGFGVSQDSSADARRRLTVPGLGEVKSFVSKTFPKNQIGVYRVTNVTDQHS